MAITYMAVTYSRLLYNTVAGLTYMHMVPVFILSTGILINNKFVTVSLPKRFRNGRFTSETSVRRFQKLNRHLDPEAQKKTRWGF
jgi:hypothetical protein